MIATGENGVNNKIIFTDAGTNSYSIEKIVKININNETDLDLFRRLIYENEQYGISTEVSQLFNIYETKDFPYYEWIKNRGRSTSFVGDNKGSKNGTRFDGETKRYSLLDNIIDNCKTEKRH